MLVDRVSVAQDDDGVWWLQFYIDDIRQAVVISRHAAQHALAGGRLALVAVYDASEVEEIAPGEYRLKNRRR